MSYQIGVGFKILYAKDVDQRSSTFEKSIEMGKEYQKRTRSVVLRTLVLKYNISVKVVNFVLNQFLRTQIYSHLYF